MSQVFSLSTQFDAHQAARQNREIHANVPLKSFTRLAALLTDSVGNADIDLHFHQDMYGIDHLRGRIRAQLPLACQRCAESFLLEVAENFQFALVLSEGALGQAEENEEPLLTEGKPISLHDLMEDELLLALPMVPKHPEEACSIKDGKFEI